ncbi:uncharacterized protein B0T15DRAFT_549614 [Chaetomium strumarium]|uniref:Uncharacterized protein n=1 Tax=Chaetomium strumarium TaxID=1170767 RepID=A0AAJ0GXP9_9PEZI|nr:hypothetical protein B0T15DRAFT_549614 [Chaetomium strumarium]
MLRISSVRGGIKDTAPSAAVIADNIIRVYGSESRSRSEASSHGRKRVRGPVRSSTPTPTRSPSAGRSRPRQHREPSPAAQTVDEKVQRFLRSMSPPSPTEELKKENRSLHQRVAALQLTERDLLNDNQDLARRLASTQKRQETRRRQWKEELLNREKVFEARIKDLESRLARQEEELVRVTLGRTRETAGLSDHAIASWFATKASAWHGWAEDFAHQDPDRVRSGLHPLQLQLPEGLLSPAGNDGAQTAQVLLQGITLELESPGVSRIDSPIGFRMDLAMWDLDVSPPGDVRSPRPAVMANGGRHGPHAMRSLPRLVTSMESAGSSPLGQNLPTRRATEGLHRMFLNAPGGAENVNAWRSSVLKAFCEGGMSTSVDSILLTEDAARPLSRGQAPVRGLKDAFLRSPARFLLRDQDAAGIEKLERRLVQEMDSALRFSCQLWCRREPISVRGLDELVDTAFSAASDSMELCQAQQAPPPPRYAQ